MLPGRMRGQRCQRGQNTLEYVGLVVLVAAIVTALVSLGLPSRISGAYQAAVCTVVQQENCQQPDGSDAGTDSSVRADGAGQAGPDGNTGVPEGGVRPGQEGSSGPVGEGSGEQGSGPGVSNFRDRGSGSGNGDGDGGSGSGGDGPGGHGRDGDSSGGGGATQTGSGDSGRSDLEKAKAELASLQKQRGSAWDLVLGLLADFVGITDAKKCLTEGDIWACIWTVANVGSLIFAVGKIPKLIKTINKARKVYARYQRLSGRIAAAKKRVQRLKQRARNNPPDKKVLACAPNSFLPTTPVLLPSGRHRPISEIEVGDRVLAGNPAVGLAAPRRVTDVITGTGVKHLVEITVDTDGHRGNATASVTATAEHPFWVDAQGAWVDAEDLVPGMQLSTPGADDAVVLATRDYMQTRTVYNLTVAGVHTYYVTAGGTNLLVHNAKDCDFPPPKITDEGLNHSFKHAKEWFGRPVNKSTHWDKWRALIERASRSKKVVPWKSGDTLTYGKFARIDGKPFFVQYSRKTGKLVTAIVPNQKQLNLILKRLGK